jgi:hypothetical protein
METALRYELNKITEIKDKIYPTNAPEGATGPYLIYARISTKPIKTLEGYTDNEAISYMFSIMAIKYSDMVRIRKQVKELLKGMVKREIGNTTKFFIEDLDINNIDEQYEHELGVNRGIIDFTIYF